MAKKNESTSVYSLTDAQWIVRFDLQATQEKANGAEPRYDVVVTQSTLRKLVALSLSTDSKDIALLHLLATKGIDPEYFKMIAQYDSDLTALMSAGSPDPRVEAVLSPADHQLIEEAHGLLSALRSAAARAGESVGRVEDAKPVGRGRRVAVTAQGVIDGILQFLAGAKLTGALLLDAGIGQEELTELEAYLPKLRAVTQSKEERTGARETRTANIELKLLAIDSALDLYRSRAATATRNDRAMLPLALKPLPRSPERRKPAAPTPADAAAALAIEPPKMTVNVPETAAAAEQKAREPVAQA